MPPLRLRLRGDCSDQSDTSGACQRGMVLPDRGESSKSTPRRRVGGGQVDIGAIELNADGEVLIDVSEDLMFGHGIVLRRRGLMGVAMWKP